MEDLEPVIRGVVFDLDGTLADTEPLQWAATRHALLEFGVDVGVEEYRRNWIAVAGGAEYACRTYALPVSPEELRERKSRRYGELIAAGVPARPGARAALERLRGVYALALATNSTRAETDVVLARTGLGGRFDAVVAREDYARRKPAPDAYLAAARGLGLAPAACVVVEDTSRGVASAVAAGCVAVAVPNELTTDNDFTGAACRLPGLDALTVALLQSLSGAR